MKYLFKNTVKVWLGPNILYFDSNKVSNIRKIFFSEKPKEVNQAM